jgi:hypothetical protein
MRLTQNYKFQGLLLGLLCLFVPKFPAQVRGWIL